MSNDTSERATERRDIKSPEYWKDVVVGVLGIGAVVAVLSAIGWVSGVVGIFPDLVENPNPPMYFIAGVLTVFFTGMALVVLLFGTVLLSVVGEVIRDSIWGEPSDE